MSSNFDLFAKLFHNIDTVTNSFVTDVSSNAITQALPFITASLTLSFVLYGLLVARGVVDDSLRDFFFKSFKIGVIVSIATTGGLYQTQIAQAIQTTPDSFAAALLPSSAGEAEGNTAATLLDKAAQEGADQATKAFQKMSLMTTEGLLYGFIGIIITATSAVLTSVGGAFILIAKVALAVLAALGPLFIFALIFKSTQRFFEAWCAQIITYALMIILISAVFGVFIKMYTSYMENINFDGDQNMANIIIGSIVISIVSILLILQIPSIAGGLSQGVAVTLWHELRIANRGARATGHAVSGAVHAGVASAQAVGHAGAGATNVMRGLYRGTRRNGA